MQWADEAANALEQKHCQLIEETNSVGIAAATSVRCRSRFTPTRSAWGIGFYAWRDDMLTCRKGFNSVTIGTRQ